MSSLVVPVRTVAAADSPVLEWSELLQSTNIDQLLSACKPAVSIAIPFTEVNRVDDIKLSLKNAGFLSLNEEFSEDGIMLYANVGNNARSTDIGDSSDDVGIYLARADEFRRDFERMRESLAPAEFWYPYGSLDNWFHLHNLLTGSNRDIAGLVGSGPVADIGCADGDMSFFLETFGYEIDAVDYGPTNFNKMEGIRKLKDGFHSNISITETDLDSHFELPRSNYGLAIFLGTLYHLKNPYAAMESLSQHARWCLVSTRVTRHDQENNNIEHIPAAYLVSPTECNDDSTNYWMFTHLGLQRLFERCGWEIHDYLAVGDVVDSNPIGMDHDERAFALLRSTSR